MTEAEPRKGGRKPYDPVPNADFWQAYDRLSWEHSLTFLIPFNGSTDMSNNANTFMSIIKSVGRRLSRVFSIGDIDKMRTQPREAEGAVRVCLWPHSDGGDAKEASQRRLRMLREWAAACKFDWNSPEDMITFFAAHVQPYYRMARGVVEWMRIHMSARAFATTMTPMARAMVSARNASSPEGRQNNVLLAQLFALVEYVARRRDDAVKEEAKRAEAFEKDVSFKNVYEDATPDANDVLWACLGMAHPAPENLLQDLGAVVASLREKKDNPIVSLYAGLQRRAIDAQGVNDATLPEFPRVEARV